MYCCTFLNLIFTFFLNKHKEHNQAGVFLENEPQIILDNRF